MPGVPRRVVDRDWTRPIPEMEWQALLWANGRVDLPGQQRQAGWRWHCAPLAEWDGTNPRGVDKVD